MDHKIKYEKDELRGCFTRFMEVVVRNARNNYLKKLSRQLPIIPLEDVPEEEYAREDMPLIEKPDAFTFAEERLAKAFSQLPLMR